MPKYLEDDVITGNIIHEWSVREYEKHERGIFWYIAMMSLALALIVYAVLTDNFVFALIIILSAIIIYLQANQHPNEVNFSIAEFGVIVGGRFYPYQELHSFYIIYNPPEVKTLYLPNKSPMRPTIRVPLDEINPVEIRRTLITYLTEDMEKEEEPRSDTLARRWKIH